MGQFCQHFMGQFHQHLMSNSYVRRYQKCKKAVKSSVFALLGSAHVKAAYKTLEKLTPAIDFTKNIYTQLLHK